MNGLLVMSIRIEVFHDPLYTLAYGTDASFYRLIPKLVIIARDEKEVSLILKESSQTFSSRNFPSSRNQSFRTGNNKFGAGPLLEVTGKISR